MIFIKVVISLLLKVNGLNTPFTWRSCQDKKKKNSTIYVKTIKYEGKGRLKTKEWGKYKITNHKKEN